MTERTPVEVTNLDIYGNAPLDWSRVRDQIPTGHKDDKEVHAFLGTAQPDGRTHSAGAYALWHDGHIFFVSGPETRKSRNLAVNPSCTISMALEGIDLVLEGTASRVTDKETLETLVELLRGAGWPVEAEEDALTAPYSAPSAGTPPYYLYRFTIDTAVGVAGKEPNGATRWSFAR